MSPIIELTNLTKDYGENKGIFNLNLTIQKGEMIGFAGTNGSGKTTTIRHIMGFLKPSEGHAYVNGLESWQNASEIAKHIGYVPGEIAFPDLKTGIEFLKSQANFMHLKDMTYANYLIQKLQLDPRASLKRMSKGMKQKTAIVAALMANPEIIILDEPTTGLDPLMRDAFLDIIKEEHKKGKTIFMSSHMFEELESTCDKVALICDGHIVDVASIHEIKNPQEKEYKIEFKNNQDYQKFKSLNYLITRDQPQFNQVTIKIKNKELNQLFKSLKNLDVKFITENTFNLEKHFKNVLSNLKKEESKHV